MVPEMNFFFLSSSLSWNGLARNEVKIVFFSFLNFLLFLKIFLGMLQPRSGKNNIRIKLLFFFFQLIPP